MRHLLIMILSILTISVFAECVQKNPSGGDTTNNPHQDNQDALTNKMKIIIGDLTYTATLFDHPTVKAFRALLPLTVEMRDLNRNEKFCHLPTNLPTDTSNPGTIQNGDLMLWQSDGLVLFYKTFTTSYSYTKLGKIDDPSGLAEAVGSGNVTITFELE